MINFRFHLVSLVAVFLALALGVVMGSTVIDRAIVDRLSSQIDSVKKRADAERAENRTLRDQMKGLETFIAQSGPQVSARRLNQVPVTIVAVRGVPGEDVKASYDILRSAGALVPGVLWIEDGFSASDPGARAKLVQAMGDSGLAYDDLRQVALEALGHRLAAGPRVTTVSSTAVSTTVSGGAGESDLDTLVALNEAGLVSFDPMGGGAVDLESWPSPGARMLVIDGSQAHPPPGTMTIPILRAAAAAGGRLALAEVFRPTATVKARGAVVRGVREDAALSRVVSTVDDLDDTRGQVALTLAVQELGTDRAGHYGEGPGASAQLPTPEAAPPEGVPAAAGQVNVAVAHRAASPPTAVGRAARVMAAATAISRVLGFGRVLVIAAVLGTTDLGNTFSASNSVSNVLFDLLAAGALSAVLVPAFVELLDRRPIGAGAATGAAGGHVDPAGGAGPGEGDAEQLAGALLGWSLVVLGPICLVGVLAAPALARLLTTGTADPAVAAAQRHLATFLLRLFVPQVLLYAVGAVTTAVLHAKRRFTVTAVAPIGNTVMMVAALVTFRVLHGPGAAGFDLSLGERLSLGAAGTLGVTAFVAIPAVALRRTGFRLRLRAPRPAAVPGLGRAVRLSGWAGLQHAGTAVLLASALLVGMGVSGGVVAYQVAFACFLVPYAVLALPLITAVLPELAGEAGRGDLPAFGRSLRWALDGMVGFVVPVSVAGVVFAPRVMQALAFGQTSEGGGRLIGFGLAALAAGLLPYGAFLLFVRAHYALGEGRAPAVAALASAALGAVLMAAGGALAHGDAKLAVMGAAHSVAYLIGAAVLGAGLARRTGQPLAPARLPRALAVAVALGVACAAVLHWVDPAGRTATLGLVLLLAAASAALYLAALGPRRVASSATPDRPSAGDARPAARA